MIDNEFICPFCGSHNDPWFDRSFEIWTNPKTGEETHLGPFERCSDCGNDLSNDSIARTSDLLKDYND